MITFSLFVLDIESQFMMGWQMVGFIILNSFINVTVIVGIGGKGLYLIVKKYYRLLKYKICGIGNAKKIFFDSLAIKKIDE